MCACDRGYTCSKCLPRDWSEDDCEREERERYERLGDSRESPPLVLVPR